MNVLDPTVARFIDDFNKNDSSLLKEFRDYCETEHIPLIKNDTESFLVNLLKIKRPSRILEVGTGAGYSATIFSKACPECNITTIEMIDKRIELAKENFKKYDVDDMINLVEGDATISLKNISENINRDSLYDFVFIDCAKSRYKDFFTSAISMTAAGGIIVCDNVMLEGRTASDSFIEKRRDKTSTARMREFTEYLKYNKIVAGTSLLNIGDGLTLSLV